MNTVNRLGYLALVYIVIAVISVTATSCKGSPNRSTRRVILVVIDTLRGDYLGCAGGPVTTPVMDRLAENGVRFTQARSHIPITGPSHSSLFTGLYPTDHHVLNNTQILNESFLTLAERFQSDGWYTAAHVSLGVLRADFGMDQGFDMYDEKVGNDWARNAGQVNDAVIPTLQTLAEKEEFFLWVHYSDPHEPYSAPGRQYPKYQVLYEDGTTIGEVSADGGTYSIPVEMKNGRRSLTLQAIGEGPKYPKEVALETIRMSPSGGRFETGLNVRQGPQPQDPVYFARPPATMMIVGDNAKNETFELRFKLRRRLPIEKRRAEYGFEVEYVDQQLGLLLAQLESYKLLENSLLILTSDHGEGLGDHGLFEHIHQLYDSLLKVPLIMVAPGILEAGVTIDAPVSLVDLLPTICEICALPQPEEIRGRSLIPLLKGTSSKGSRHIAMTFRPQSRVNLEGVVVNNLKLIRHPDNDEIELFDLALDPGEVNNVVETRQKDTTSLRKTLSELCSASSVTPNWADLDEESVKRLEALGYVQ